MKDQIKITVEKDGKITLTVQGVSGSKCLAMTEALERDLGEVLERHRTSDFYRATRQTLRNSIRQENESA